MYQLLENNKRNDKVGVESSNSGSEVQCSTTELFVLVTLIYKKQITKTQSILMKDCKLHPLQ